MPCTWRPTNATLIWELVGQGGSLEATDKVGQGNYNGVVQVCGGLCVLLRRSVCGVHRTIPYTSPCHKMGLVIPTLCNTP